MENTKNPITTDPIQAVTIPSDKLLTTLYYLFDAFDRCGMPYFLVNQTAKDAILGHDLTGNKVEIGVRANEWRGGATRVLKAFLGESLTEDEKQATFEYLGVPIIIHFYEDSPFVMAPDTILYRHERFLIPNPYKGFEEHYGKSV